MKLLPDAPRDASPPSPAELVVEDLLLRIELAGSPGERACCEAELEELAAADPEVAEIYQSHQVLEDQLRQLASRPEWWPGERVSPLKSFFRRLRSRFSPGPVG